MATKNPIKTVPFTGGCNTAVEPALLKPGEYSMLQNVRSQHPGFETRKGQAALHTSADGTNQVVSLYPFCKGRRSEDHLFAQMGDSDVLEATNLPPAITTGAFGAEVFSGSASQLPASWSNLLDNLLFSNGVDQHQIWSGSLSYVRKFVLYRKATPWNPIPTIGQDYTDEVTDGVSTTFAPMNGLGTLAADTLLICIPTIPSGLKFTVGVANTTTATMAISYWKGSVQALTITDNTAVAGKTLAQTGTVTWTPVTDAKTYQVYGACGYWLAITFNAALSATTAITSAEYLSSWQPISNIWDGVLMDAIEALVYTAATTNYKTYGGAAINVGALGSSDVIYFATTDPIFGIFIDVGQTPNTTAGTTINSFKFWDGTAWTTVGTLQDGTNGLKNSGWIIWPTLSATPQPLNLMNSEVYMYWWQVQVSNTLSANMTIWVQYQPTYDIDELGKGVTNCAWKGRAVYSFDRWPDYLYISAQGNPQALNGDGYGIVRAGDGRDHKVVALRRFHNELLAYQEEKGEIGGCLTLIEGASPTTYGTLILSSHLGTMNSKCVAVVDGVLTSTATEETIKTLAFALSRYGIYATDGRTCSFVSEEIRNYFDPTKPECIRRGYENQMWLNYDAGCNVIRIGLVSGASATVPNVFPVFDLIDKTWSFDVLGQALSCQIDVGAASGNVPAIQIGGGAADGLVYQVNTGVIDVATAISTLVRMEIDGQGVIIDLREFILRVKSQAAGSLTMTPFLNNIAQTAKTLAMTAELSNQTIRRHRFNLNVKGQHITLEFTLSTASQILYLLDFWPLLIPYQDQ
jgi:hypothetical protein